MKTCRKTWMKALQAYSFNRDGTMTTETAKEQKHANSAGAYCVVLSKQLKTCPSPKLKAELIDREILRRGFVRYARR